jgi:hypothetical protein
MYLPVLAFSLLTQSSLDSAQCIKALNETLPTMRTSSGMSFRLESTNENNGFMSLYKGTFKFIKNEYGIKSELKLWRDNNLIQRVVADGKSVWGHNLLRNEYTVARYSTPPHIPDEQYIKKYVSSVKYPVLGVGQHMMTLADQVGFVSPSLKDWIGGISWQGKLEVDENNSLRIVKRIYQLVADYRYVMWELESFDEGVTFNFSKIKIYNKGFDGVITTSYLYLDEIVGADYSGFKFVPNNGSKVLWIKD